MSEGSKDVSAVYRIKDRANEQKRLRAEEKKREENPQWRGVKKIYRMLQLPEGFKAEAIEVDNPSAEREEDQKEMGLSLRPADLPEGANYNGVSIFPQLDEHGSTIGFSTRFPMETKMPPEISNSIALLGEQFREENEMIQRMLAAQEGNDYSNHQPVKPPRLGSRHRTPRWMDKTGHIPPPRKGAPKPPWEK